MIDRADYHGLKAKEYTITIPTTYGDMDEDSLIRTDGEDETNEAVVRWVEYRLPDSDEVIHRSAHIEVKLGIMTQALTAEF
jgi:hypothetical protein